MRPSSRVIHDIPAVSVFFFCSSSGMRLGQAVLAGENHLPPDQALPQWKKTDQLLRDVLWLVPTGDHTLSRLELIQTQTEIYYFHINK